MPQPWNTQPGSSLPSYLTRSPSGYTCAHGYSITTSIYINNIHTLANSPSSNSFANNNNVRTSPIFAHPSSLSLLLQGYSFPANQYPFLTIVISLKVTAYVQSLSLGPQSNVQRYGLRLYNPARNVDDTYYSSTDGSSGQPMISGIPMAKVAVRLYINLYTTSDGRPPSNLQLTFVSRGGWYL